MAKNCRCHCSSLFSCFSCFSASNTNPSPAQDGTVELLDTQTLSAPSPHVSISHGLADSSQVASSDANAVNDNTNAVSPNVVTQEAVLVTDQDPETLLSAPHASTAHASSSAVKAASSQVGCLADSSQVASGDVNAVNDNTNAASQNVVTAGDGTVERLDTQTLSASPHVSISHGLADSSQVASSDANAVNDNTNAASPNVVTQEAVHVTEGDPKTVLPAPHASTSHASSSTVEATSSSEFPALVNQDYPGSDEATKGSSSSSKLQTLSDALKDAATAEGDYVKVDLDGLIQHISELLKQIKVEGNCAVTTPWLNKHYNEVENWLYNSKALKWHISILKIILTRIP